MALNVDTPYAQYQGQSVSVDGIPANFGQCAQWVCKVLQANGLPIFWGNAIDYWDNPGWLLDHFDKVNDGAIKKGDIVVFNQNVGSVYGHVDVAMQDGSYNQFTGADSNWGGNKTVHLVNHVGPQYIRGVLRLKGEDMSAQADADYRQQLLTQIAKEVSVDYKDGNSVPQVISNIRTLYTLINQKDAQIAELQKGVGYTKAGTLDGKDYYEKTTN